MLVAEPNVSNNRSEMPCQELVEVLTDYLEGALRASDKERLEQHLTQCRSCRTYLDQMRQVIFALGKLSESDIPAAGRQELMAVFHAWKTGAA